MSNRGRGCCCWCRIWPVAGSIRAAAVDVLPPDCDWYEPRGTRATFESADTEPSRVRVRTVMKIGGSSERSANRRRAWSAKLRE